MVNSTTTHHEFITDSSGSTKFVLYELPPIEIPWWHYLLPWETDRQREVRSARQHLRHYGHWPAYPLDWGPCHRCSRNDTKSVPSGDTDE